MNEVGDVELTEDEKLFEKLDAAAWAYMEKIREILSPLTDNELARFAGTDEQQRCEWQHEQFCRREAAFELMGRRIFKRVADYEASHPDFSGAYCVYHDCDMKDCSDKHDAE